MFSLITAQHSIEEALESLVARAYALGYDEAAERIDRARSIVAATFAEIEPCLAQ